VAELLVESANLVKIYKSADLEVVALQGLDLHVPRGEMLALVGPSGAGKSTLLNILGGLDEPSAGRCSVAGIDLSRLSGRERIYYRRRIVGHVWQQTSRNLMPYLTGAENVTLPMRLAGMGGRQRRARAAELLGVLGVARCADRYPGQMSGGEQQCVAVAVAMANQPRVILADEPTGELDSVTAGQVFEALRTVNAESGVTVLVVTHDEAVSGQVRRTIAIRDGRTSTEVLREAGQAGGSGTVAEEYAVLDRSGRLQLPADFTETLGMRERVRLALDTDHIGVWPTAPDQPAPAPPEPAGAPLGPGDGQ